jgi:hypothetical protein
MRAGFAWRRKGKQENGSPVSSLSEWRITQEFWLVIMSLIERDNLRKSLGIIRC